MPKTKIKKKSEHDKFYTNTETAKYCINAVLPLLESNPLWIEPSAGNGSFLLQIKGNKVGFDIEPEHDEIIKSDFLNISKESIQFMKTSNGCDQIVVIGNPPFGERGVMVNKFIRHSLSFADVIAFIVPDTFRKFSRQKIFPRNWRLVTNFHLGADPQFNLYGKDIPQFTLYGKDIYIPTAYQIWVNEKSKSSVYWDLRESAMASDKVCTSGGDVEFEFVNKSDANWFIFGAAPHRIIPANEVKSTNRGYYIRCSLEIRDRLSKIDWKSFALSSVSGGVAWFTKHEIFSAYTKSMCMLSKQP